MIEYKTLVKRVLDKLFPSAEERKQATDVLVKYGGASWQPEEDRVRLAILKLAGKSLDQIQYYTVQACRDYRNVLASAESPHQMANPYIRKNDPDRYAELVEEDKKQYREWYLGILWGEGETIED